jgi:hypothetical protein
MFEPTIETRRVGTDLSPVPASRYATGDAGSLDQH